MDSPRGNIEDPQNVALHHPGGEQDEGEHHVEKQSLYNRVKAKAKKMKESFKGHGHDKDVDDVDDDNVDGGNEINLDDHAAPGKEGITSQHETNISERAADGDHSPVSDLGTYQAFDRTIPKYVPSQEETIDCSRTDKPTNIPDIGQSTGSQSTGGLGVVRKPKLGGILEKDHRVEDVPPAKYQAEVNDATPGETPRQHEGNLDDGATVEGASHTPESKPVEYQTFDTTTSIYIPGEEETLGRSRTDTGESELSEEQPDSPKNTPVLDHCGHYHTGGPESGEMEKFAKHEDRPSILEKDPHASRDVGEKLHAENYQTEFTDPTGRGAEEIGETPILHELGKMNIHDESTQKLDLKKGQQEDKYISAGNHDQFSPQAVTKTQLDATVPTSQGFHDEEEQKPESYNDKIPHDSLTNADSTVSFDQKPDQDSLDKKPVAGAYRETISSISSSITNSAALAKDAVASKLGYGETEEQSGTEYQVVSTDSFSDKENSIDEATKVAKKERETELNEEKKVVVKGRVTESEEVANRVGKAEDTNYDDAGPGLASPGKSVMDRLKDAAGSWFNQSGGEPHVEPLVESSGDRIEEGNDRTQANTIKETGLN